ncbi:MAG: hypothetical protein K5868_03510 [Lachnospiraceae bacterium]|nr:hypothetical protein [Lachnospiraceae bacterium]
MQGGNQSRIITNFFFKLLPVQIILVAIGSLNGIIDGAMASNLIGPIALTATGMFNPVVTLTNMINAVLLGGASILCGQFMGKNQLNRTRSVFTLDIILVGILGIVLTVMCFLFPGAVAMLLGAKGGLLDRLADYTRGYSFGFIPVMLAAQLSQFLQMERQEKCTYVGIGVMLLTNAGFDWLFVGILKSSSYHGRYGYLGNAGDQRPLCDTCDIHPGLGGEPVLG